MDNSLTNKEACLNTLLIGKISTNNKMHLPKVKSAQFHFPIMKHTLDNIYTNAFPYPFTLCFYQSFQSLHIHQSSTTNSTSRNLIDPLASPCYLPYKVKCNNLLHTNTSRMMTGLAHLEYQHRRELVSDWTILH